MLLVTSILLKMGFPLLCLASLIYIVFFKKKRNDNNYSLVVCILAIWFMELIIYATVLIAIPYISLHTPKLINLIPFIWLFDTYSMGFEKMMQQIILNIVMFMPIGFLLPIAFKKYRYFKATLIYLVIVIFSIEFIQYFIGRSADIDDFICNICGGMLGYYLYYMTNNVYYSNFIWRKINNLND